MKNHAISLRGLEVFLFLFCVHLHAAQFPIYVNPATNIKQPAQSIGTDGTNYLVGFQIHLASGESRVVAQLVSSTGAQVGTLIDTGVSGDPPKAIGFDGANYLLLWAANQTAYGQFISRSGEKVGGPFRVSESTTVEDLDAVAFTGSSYLVTWTDGRRITNNSNYRDVYARLISTSGTVLDADFLVAQNAIESSLAFDGTNCLAVFRDDLNDRTVLGRLISPSGVFVTGSFEIDANSHYSDNLNSVIFDGSRYVVAINDEIGGSGGSGWDLFGRFVTTSGTVLPDRFTISDEPGGQIIPKMAFDGANYLISWYEISGACKAAFFDSTGKRVSASFNLFSPVGGKTPLFAPVLFDGKQFFSATGLLAGFNNGEIYGAIIPQLALDLIPAANRNEITLRVNGIPGVSYAIQATSALIPANTEWTTLSVIKSEIGPFIYTDTTATLSGNRFYRVVMQ